MFYENENMNTSILKDQSFLTFQLLSKLHLVKAKVKFILKDKLIITLIETTILKDMITMSKMYQISNNTSTGHGKLYILTYFMGSP
jgi:hypothetical protein